MKKILFVLALAVAAIAPSWADGASVTVQNQELWRFWYVLDPPGFADESPGSSWLGPKVAAYLAKEGEELPFTALEPAEMITFTELAEGTHYLLGFFEDDSLEELPVRLITVQADSSMGARHYDVYSVPELMMAVRGQGMLTQFARTAEAVEEVAAAEEPAVEEAVSEVVEEPVAEEPVAEAVEEMAAAEEATVEEPVAEVVEEPVTEEPVAEAVEEVAAAEEPAVEEAVSEVVEEHTTEVEAGPVAAVTDESVDSGELATFAESYDPVYFTRESHDGFVVLPIASSRAWGRPGTRLSAFTGSLTDGTLAVVVRSPDGFAKNVSCFFYVFPVRSAGRASDYTFEARPDADGRAAVVLWQKGRAVPRLVGTAITAGGEFTWTVRADELPLELAQELGPETTFDLTTAWLDETSGTWEEFYFTTFAVADLTR
jgi:hypothetical protein